MNQFIDANELGTSASVRTLFRYFDAAGDGDYAVTYDEALAGINTIAEQVGHFYNEINYFRNFFDTDNDECVTHDEMQT